MTDQPATEPAKQRVVKVTRQVTVTTYVGIDSYRDWTLFSKDKGRQMTDDEIISYEKDREPADAFQSLVESVECAHEEDISHKIEIEIIDVEPGSDASNKTI